MWLASEAATCFVTHVVLILSFWLHRIADLHAGLAQILSALALLQVKIKKNT